MFCRNCGKEMLNDSKFCSSCGTPVEPNITPKRIERVTNSQLTPEKIQKAVPFDKTTVVYYISIILSALIIFLTFSSWLSVDSGRISSNFSTFDFIEITDKLPRYISNNFISGLVTFLVLLMISIISLSLYYIIKVWRGGIHSAYHGDSAMSAIAIICSLFTLFIILLFAFTEEYKSTNIYFNEKMYFIIILACINKVVAIPILKNASITIPDEHILNDDEWLCQNCKHKNKAKHSICENCGKLR